MPYTIITHDGKAHMDELLASALLALHLKEEPREIRRIPSAEAAGLTGGEEQPADTWFIDCGMALDLENKLIDHHQDGSLGSAALLVFEGFFPHLKDSALHDYIRLVSRVDTRGIKSLDDSDLISESRQYWAFSQKILLRAFEEDPSPILRLVMKGLQDKMDFEQARQEAFLWMKEPGNIEIVEVGDLKILKYNKRPPADLASPLRSADGDVVDEHEAAAVYSFDDRNPDGRVLFRTNHGEDRLNFTLALPEAPLFCHQGGFLLKFIPSREEEWMDLISRSVRIE